MHPTTTGSPSLCLRPLVKGAPFCEQERKSLSLSQITWSSDTHDKSHSFMGPFSKASVPLGCSICDKSHTLGPMASGQKGIRIWQMPQGTSKWGHWGHSLACKSICMLQTLQEKISILRPLNAGVGIFPIAHWKRKEQQPMCILVLKLFWCTLSKRLCEDWAIESWLYIR